MEPFLSSKSFRICSMLLCGNWIFSCSASLIPELRSPTRSLSSSLTSKTYFRYAFFFTFPLPEPAASICSLISHCLQCDLGFTLFWHFRQNLAVINRVKSLNLQLAQHRLINMP